MTIYAGAVGVTVTLATGQDLAEATKLQINVLYPDGTTDEWAAVESGTAGSIEYTTLDGDLDQAGIYSLSAYIEWGSLSAHLGEPCSLEVEPVQTVPTPDWTYAADFTTARDQIRLRIGDTDEDDLLLYDEEIEAAYAEGGTIVKGALVAARWCAAKLAREFDKTIGKMSTKRSQRHAAMLQLIADLQEEIKQDAWSCTWSSARTMAAVTDTTAFPALFRPTDTTTAREQEDD